MPTQRPTAKQQQVLDFISVYIKQHGYAPTFREIGKHIGVEAGAVHNFLNALEARHLITRNANESRSIQLTGVK
jgi:repressor LexA